MPPQQILDRIRKFGVVSFDSLVAAIARDPEYAGPAILGVPWDDFYHSVGITLALAGKSIDDLEAAVRERMGAMR